jgi:eukaryotic-like serine/threonine-protein kinase
MDTPAQQLEGRTLERGWTVRRHLQPGPEATGGCFSEQYEVEHQDGRRGFLKALDFARTMRGAPDPAAALEPLILAFNFERSLLARCRDKKLDRIVVAIDDGTVRLNDTSDGVVQYLIFELADGDLRRQAAHSTRFDVAWKLRSLHHIATGLRQLHSQNAVHQDLKPSNVLVFGGNTSKLADLGRAAWQGTSPPHEDHVPPGDRGYSPPEFLFGHLEPDWTKRRVGCDLYHLGSMLTFCFTGVGMTALLINEMKKQTRDWRPPYLDALPYVREAFENVLEAISPSFPDDFRSDLLQAVRQLCDPDPNRRGDMRARLGSVSQYQLDRFVSLFDRLARRAEMGFVTGR